LFADLNAETQILSRRFEEDASDSMLSEITEICQICTHDINWSKGDLLILDNRRFMHGRRALTKGSRRSISISQAEVSRLIHA
jgi:alpha-ketoglutarate-dependent taurine dioxygenase